MSDEIDPDWDDEVDPEAEPDDPPAQIFVNGQPLPMTDADWTDKIVAAADELSKSIPPTKGKRTERLLEVLGEGLGPGFQQLAALMPREPEPDAYCPLCWRGFMAEELGPDGSFPIGTLCADGLCDLDPEDVAELE